MSHSRSIVGRQRKAYASALDGLTLPQCERVLQAQREGKPLKQIAQSMGISPEAVALIVSGSVPGRAG